MWLNFAGLLYFLNKSLTQKVDLASFFLLVFEYSALSVHQAFQLMLFYLAGKEDL